MNLSFQGKLRGYITAYSRLGEGGRGGSEERRGIPKKHSAALVTKQILRDGI